MEKSMILDESKITPHSDAQPVWRIFLRPNEALYVPFKYRSFNVVDVAKGDGEEAKAPQEVNLTESAVARV